MSDVDFDVEAEIAQELAALSGGHGQASEAWLADMGYASSRTATSEDSGCPDWHF